ncbi:MAG: aldo/keto reductase [Verrucomicrobia bacterium]|nr:aldo/keto reductase [Verrucomicrobiota bacterium]
MQLHSLGHTGIQITPVILGTWAIGGWMWGGPDDANAIEAIQESIDQGITTIDTAPFYGMGHSEEIVGKAIKGKRNKLIIATKCGMRWDSEEGSAPQTQYNREGKSFTIRKTLRPASIFKECDESLKRLGIEYIDLYQIHWPDPATPMEESWDAMVQLKKRGKVRAIGVCNYELEQLKAIHAIHPVDSLQPPYSLLRRGIENEVIPFCQKQRISVIVYSPLERGLLTGKYTPKSHFPEGDHRVQKITFSESYLEQVQKALDLIRPLAVKHKATLAQVIIDCTIHRPGIAAALVGARNAAQAKENAQGATLHLSEEERALVAMAFANPKLQRPEYD